MIFLMPNLAKKNKQNKTNCELNTNLQLFTCTTVDLLPSSGCMVSLRGLQMTQMYFSLFHKRTFSLPGTTTVFSVPTTRFMFRNLSRVIALHVQTLFVSEGSILKVSMECSSGIRHLYDDGPLILDGGLATDLEAQGARLKVGIF